MLGRHLNPYEKPLYFSVALVLLGLAWMTLMLERSRDASPLYKQPATCGVVYEDAYPPVPMTRAEDSLARMGSTIFRNQCASCHNRNMRDNLTGPALGGVGERWTAYPREDLYAWVRNSQAMISEGHPHAVELWMEWGPTLMPNFPALTDEEIEGILAYIEHQYVGNGPVIP